MCGGQLCFSSRANINRDACGDAVNGCVDEVGGVVPKGVESSSFRAGVGEREIGGVGMNLEEHGGWADDTAVVGEFGKVAKQSFLGCKNGGSRFGLEGGEGSDSFKGSDVVGPGIVKGRANDFLKLSGLSGGGRGGGVSGGKLRCGGSTHGRDIDGGGGSMFDTARVVSFEHVGDIGGHGWWWCGRCGRGRWFDQGKCQQQGGL